MKLTLRKTTSCYFLYEVSYWFLIPSVVIGNLFNNLRQKVQELSVCGARTTVSLLDLFCTTSSLISSAFMLSGDLYSCEKWTAIFVIIWAWRIDGKQVAFFLRLFLNVMEMNSQLMQAISRKYSLTHLNKFENRWVFMKLLHFHYNV